MGKLTLYGIDGSAPVRSVLLTLGALNVPYEYKIVNLFAKEHLKPEFLKKNPQHTLPTLDDDGFLIWDSHAINAYLASKYGKTDTLYPKDLQQRAIVDQRLHYDSSVVFPAIRTVVFPLFFQNDTKIPKARIDAIAEIYSTLELFLKNHSHIAGNNLTIADLHFIAAISTATAFLEIDRAQYPKLAAWLELAKSLPYYAEANGKGLQQFTDLVKSKNFTIV
ncbi:glutathione S-transferase 1-like [Scaptodrosophila lebanonensis]|uniref:Glutathione S-transferase 1-like n=1 Tax=Drosophila lebanonensis TaxID=7225 RepID=A0A6J2T4Y3_DROLE|nr:glutathione S-transferase 1-like [Scaptodrosophila lebanonensis]